MLLIVMGFVISASTNLAIKPKFVGKDLHQMVSDHFSKVSIITLSVLLICLFKFDLFLTSYHPLMHKHKGASLNEMVNGSQLWTCIVSLSTLCSA